MKIAMILMNYLLYSVLNDLFVCLFSLINYIQLIFIFLRDPPFPHLPKLEEIRPLFFGGGGKRRDVGTLNEALIIINIFIDLDLLNSASS